MRTILNWKVAVLCALFLFLSVIHVKSKTEQSSESGQPEAISAVEDLMREHGALNRVLLIYEELMRRIETNKEIPKDTISSAAGIIQSFVENYHEKLEEDYIFPRFEKAGRLTELTSVLRKQHEAGRILTGKIIELSKEASFKEQKNRPELIRYMHQFIRLYRPHEAREDTVLFPAIHQMIPEGELAQLGDKFEDKEQELFGKDGFEKIVERIAGIEKSLGIYDLSQFTPK